MDLLSDEKDLKDAQQSAFWDGSYLLDGVIDRDGYSPETLTLSAAPAARRGTAGDD